MLSVFPWGAVPGKGFIPPGSSCRGWGTGLPALVSPKPTATPSPLTILILHAFCSKPKHRHTAPFAPCLTAFHYQLLGAAPGLTALWVWLPCRVRIKEHTLILLFLILSHHLRLRAAVLLYGQALCLSRWKWSLLSKIGEPLSRCREKTTARARIIPS